MGNRNAPSLEMREDPSSAKSSQIRASPACFRRVSVGVVSPLVLRKYRWAAFRICQETSMWCHKKQKKRGTSSSALPRGEMRKRKVHRGWQALAIRNKNRLNFFKKKVNPTLSSRYKQTTLYMYLVRKGPTLRSAHQSHFIGWPLWRPLGKQNLEADRNRENGALRGRWWSAGDCHPLCRHWYQVAVHSGNY